MLKRLANGENISKEEIQKSLEDSKKKMDSSTDRYLSEDYLFCQNARKAGMKVWLCPWMHLQHSGTYVFGGKLPALASIGASATADADLIKRQRAAASGVIAPTAAPRPVSPVIANDPNLIKKFKKVAL